jgi:hypothetical protein
MILFLLGSRYQQREEEDLIQLDSPTNIKVLFIRYVIIGTDKTSNSTMTNLIF